MYDIVFIFPTPYHTVFMKLPFNLFLSLLFSKWVKEVEEEEDGDADDEGEDDNDSDCDDSGNNGNGKYKREAWEMAPVSCSFPMPPQHWIKRSTPAASPILLPPQHFQENSSKCEENDSEVNNESQNVCVRAAWANAPSVLSAPLPPACSMPQPPQHWIQKNTPATSPMLLTPQYFMKPNTQA